MWEILGDGHNIQTAAAPLFFLLKILNSIYFFELGRVKMCFRSQFSSSILWVPGIEHGLSGFVASTSTH